MNQSIYTKTAFRSNTIFWLYQSLGQADYNYILSYAVLYYAYYGARSAEHDANNGWKTAFLFKQTSVNYI